MSTPDASGKQTEAPRDAFDGSETWWHQRYLVGDTPWDKGLPAPPLLEFLKSNEISGRVLVPGCGNGHDCRPIAAQGAEVTGLDVSPVAIGRARELGSDNETYVLADLFRYEADPFDWAVEHTCFCALPPARRSDYVESVARLLKPGGYLFAIFFLNPDNGGQGPPFGVPPDEIDALFGKHFSLLRQWKPKEAFEGREGREECRLYRKR